MSCTPALHKLHLPSNKTIGRESAGLNMDGMSNSDWLCCCVDLLSARTKRALKVGGDGIDTLAATAVAERDVDLTSDLDFIFCDGEKASTEATIVDAMATTSSRVDEDHIGRLLVDVIFMVGVSGRFTPVQNRLFVRNIASAIEILWSVSYLSILKSTKDMKLCAVRKEFQYCTFH